MSTQKPKFNVFHMSGETAELKSVTADINENGELTTDEGIVTTDSLFEGVSSSPVSVKLKGYIVNAANVAAAMLLHTPNTGHIRWTADEVRAMRAERAAGSSYKGLAEKYGGSVAGVRNLCLGNTRADIPFEPGTTPEEVAAAEAERKADEKLRKAEAEAEKARESANVAKAAATK